MTAQSYGFRAGIVVAVALLVCSTSAEEPTSHQLFSSRFTHFDWELTKSLGSRPNENVVISPVSLKLVLATLFEGARGNTSRQLGQALNLSQDPQKNTLPVAVFASILRSLQVPGDGYDLDVATKVYVDHGLKINEMFTSKIRYLYDAAIEGADFSQGQETVDKINKWVDSVTKGHIQHLISDGDSLKDAAMIALNAIFFKGKWLNPFDPKKTTTGEFWVGPTRSIMVQHMKEVLEVNYAEAPSIKASILRLPYEGDKFAMYIILPEKRNGLEDVVRSITPDKLRKVKEMMENRSVNLRLPKFNFEFTASLVETLKSLGLRDMFTSAANFSGIGPGSDLFVNNILQKAGLEVNEIGSIAYAATMVELVNKFGEEYVDFTVDRPFMFFIEDEPTSTVVFAGKVVDPTLRGSPTVRVIQPSNNNNQQKPQPTSTGDDDGEGEGLNRYGPSKKPAGTGRFSFVDIEFLQWVHATKTAKNFVVSPASIKTCLAVVLEAARDNTASEISRLLRLPTNDTSATRGKLHDFYDVLLDGSNEDHGVKLNMGSRVLIKEGLRIRNSFKEDVGRYYKANVNTINFANRQSTAQDINTWVNEITKGFIPALISPESLDPNMLVMVVNAFYFKGSWKEPFEESNTRSSCFYVEESRCVMTPMMTQTGRFKYGKSETLGAQILELPYANERYSMVIVLPEKSTRIRQIIRDLPFVSLITLLDDLPEEEVSVTIPKFSIEYALQMVPLLKMGGLKDLFGEKCNLMGMFTDDEKKQKAYISSVYHKAKIVVNEEGTTAGAGTALAAVPLMFQEEVNFIADHEFLYFIRDLQSGFLFEGVFAEPQGGDSGSASSAPTSRPSRPHHPPLSPQVHQYSLNKMGQDEEAPTSTPVPASPAAPPRGVVVTSRPYPHRRRTTTTEPSPKNRDSLYFN